VNLLVQAQIITRQPALCFNVDVRANSLMNSMNCGANGFAGRPSASAPAQC